MSRKYVNFFQILLKEYFEYEKRGISLMALCKLKNEYYFFLLLKDNNIEHTVEFSYEKCIDS